MDKEQMKEMTKQFSKTSTQDLKKILESVDSTQLDDILDDFVRKIQIRGWYGCEYDMIDKGLERFTISKDLLSH